MGTFSLRHRRNSAMFIVQIRVKAKPVQTNFILAEGKMFCIFFLLVSTGCGLVALVYAFTFFFLHEATRAGYSIYFYRLSGHKYLYHDCNTEIDK